MPLPPGLCETPFFPWTPGSGMGFLTHRTGPFKLPMAVYCILQTSPCPATMPATGLPPQVAVLSQRETPLGPLPGACLPRQTFLQLHLPHCLQGQDGWWPLPSPAPPFLPDNMVWLPGPPGIPHLSCEEEGTTPTTPAPPYSLTHTQDFPRLWTWEGPPPGLPSHNFVGPSQTNPISHPREGQGPHTGFTWTDFPACHPSPLVPSPTLPQPSSPPHTSPTLPAPYPGTLGGCARDTSTLPALPPGTL